MRKPLEVTLKWKDLERIAEYYEFPSVIFLTENFEFKHKTRNKALEKKAKLFNIIKKIIEQEENASI